MILHGSLRVREMDTEIAGTTKICYLTNRLRPSFSMALLKFIRTYFAAAQTKMTEELCSMYRQYPLRLI
jgi:hypothetical protein